MIAFICFGFDALLRIILLNLALIPLQPPLQSPLKSFGLCLQLTTEIPSSFKPDINKSLLLIFLLALPYILAALCALVLELLLLVPWQWGWAR